jgi:hypothetical protein
MWPVTFCWSTLCDLLHSVGLHYVICYILLVYIVWSVTFCWSTLCDLSHFPLKPPYPNIAPINIQCVNVQLHFVLRANCSTTLVTQNCHVSTHFSKTIHYEISWKAVDSRHTFPDRPPTIVGESLWDHQSCNITTMDSSLLRTPQTAQRYKIHVFPIMGGDKGEKMAECPSVI